MLYSHQKVILFGVWHFGPCFIASFRHGYEHLGLIFIPFERKYGFKLEKSNRNRLPQLTILAAAPIVASWIRLPLFER
jgi:hypothetical protein